MKYRCCSLVMIRASPATAEYRVFTARFAPPVARVFCGTSSRSLPIWNRQQQNTRNLRRNAVGYVNQPRQMRTKAIAGNKTRKASSLVSTLTWDAVSRSDSLTGSYDRTRGDEQGTIGYDCVSFVEEPGTTVMRHCNHCHGQLGLIVHRKWMLRFCSKSCKKAYEHKLKEERRAKLRHLAFLAPGAETSSLDKGCGRG